MLIQILSYVIQKKQYSFWSPFAYATQKIFYLPPKPFLLHTKVGPFDYFSLPSPSPIQKVGPLIFPNPSPYHPLNFDSWELTPPTGSHMK